MENIIICDNISIHSDNTISTQSNHSCDSCNKSFSRKYNLDRHKTSCKKNKQDTILDLQNEIRILKEQISQYKNDFRQQEKEMIRMEMKIEFMEQTNKELNNSLQQKEMENKELLKMFMEKSTKDISIIAENRMITQQKMISNPNPIITKPKKLTFESFVKEDCLEAYSINEFIGIYKEYILNQEDIVQYLNLILQMSYEKIIMNLTEKIIKNIPQNKLPFQIKGADIKEGYIKRIIDAKDKSEKPEFHKYIGNELFDKTISFITTLSQKTFTGLYFEYKDRLFRDEPSQKRDEIMSGIIQKIVGNVEDDDEKNTLKKKRDLRLTKCFLSKFIVEFQE